jgi:enamine deaminase RidA (YjgF/YER057c/UK114 family)
MARLHEVVQPTDWPRPSGYSNAIIAQGRTLFIAGQIGWNPVTRVVASDDFATQARRALENITAILRAADARPEHVVRMTWYITDRAAYIAARSELGRAWRELFGAHYPAMSVVVVAGLLEEQAQVEIEATAVLPKS